MFAVCVCIQNPFGRREKERGKNKIELYGKMENTSLGFVARGLS